MIQLTFDDGPDERFTPQILDLLRDHDVKATFFVVGSQIEGREGILLRADYEGHAIGNHSWSHPRMTELIRTQAWLELKDTSAAIAAVTGTWPAAWRAPYYATDERIDEVARVFGLTHVGADIVPDDWKETDCAVIANHVIALYESDRSQIVSLHDGIPPDGGSSACTASRQPTVDAVAMILEALA